MPGARFTARLSCTRKTSVKRRATPSGDHRRQKLRIGADNVAGQTSPKPVVHGGVAGAFEFPKDEYPRRCRAERTPNRPIHALTLNRAGDLPSKEWHSQR